MKGTQQGRTSRFAVLKQFVAMFLIGALTISAVFVSVAYHSFTLEQEKFHNTESLRLDLASKEILRTLERVAIEIFELSESDLVLDYIKDKSEITRERLQREFMNIVQITGMYDQLRLIDNSGVEKVRVNYNKGNPYVVNDSQMQDKSYRYYVKDALKNIRGSLYISPLDLNVESGVIEKPFKPVIRFILPLFVLGETKPDGILVLNYLAADVLSQYENMMKNSWGEAMILNQQGYWLYARNHRDEWGFQLNKEKKFSKRFPMAWQKILETDERYFVNEEGLFNIKTIQLTLTSGNRIARDQTKAEMWKLVSWVSPEHIQFSVWDAVKRNYKVSVVLLLLTTLISFVIAWLRAINVTKSKALKINELRYRNLFENMADGYALHQALFDSRGQPYDYRYLEVNSAFERILGMTKQQVIGKTVLELLPNTEPHWLDVFASVATTGKPARLEQFGGSFDRYFEIAATSPGYGLIAVIFADITQRKRVEQQLRQAATVFDNTIEAIMITDAEHKITSVNQAFTEVTGFSREDVLGQDPKIQKSGKQDTAFYENFWHMLTKNGQWQGEILNRRKNGELYPAWENITAVKDESGKIVQFISVFSDISAIKQAEKQLSHLAHHDALTGLANRLVFNANLEQAIERALRHKQKVALLFLDLDRFKVINDTLGHTAGDKLLQVVSDRLKQCVRAQDMVSRLGGDEFTIILEEITDSKDAAILAQKIISSITEPIQLDEQEVVVSSSVGISVYPDDASNAPDLIKAGDAAMYRAKNRGRHTFEFYVAELTEEARQRLTTEGHLRQALTRNEFRLLYQPQIDLKTGRIVGVEALLRWQHPEMGLLAPGQFIHVAEESKLISQIGDWVLAEVCEQVKVWQKMLTMKLRVAINLSLRQLIYDHTIATIKNACIKHAFSPGKVALELEITESALMSGSQVSQSLNQLRSLGISIAIDDFGTGYSSLSHLKFLPIDSLKIDRTFLRNVPNDTNNAAITVAIISMGHSLGMRVIAEGVETLDQLKFLSKQGCDQAQGFLFSEAVEAKKIGDLLTKNVDMLFLSDTNQKKPLMLEE